MLGQSRNAFLTTIVIVLLSSACMCCASSNPGPPKRIAAICTTYYGVSHADVILTRFLAGFPTDGALVLPKVKVVSLWMDQVTESDIGPKMAKKYGVTVYPTIEQALTLGGKNLAVDGVLYIGEHGNYPASRLGAKMYPHLNHLERIYRVIDESGTSVPVFCDKQLAYSWLDSKWIYDRAKDLKVPLMAGSSVPLAWRSRQVDVPIGANISEIVAVGHGTLDSYGFHVLELLQSIMERRKGGETGISSVQCLDGQAVYEAVKKGELSLELAETASSNIPDKKPGTIQENEQNPVAVILKYRDGSKGVALLLNKYYGEGWGFAARVNGKTLSTAVILPREPYNHFSYLGLNIQDFFLTGKPRSPVERTLLTSSIVDFALRSRKLGGKVIQSQCLSISYKPSRLEPIRPKASKPRPIPLSEWNPWE